MSENTQLKIIFENESIKQIIQSAANRVNKKIILKEIKAIIVTNLVCKDSSNNSHTLGHDQKSSMNENQITVVHHNNIIIIYLSTNCT